MVTLDRRISVIKSNSSSFWEPSSVFHIKCRRYNRVKNEEKNTTPKKDSRQGKTCKLVNSIQMRLLVNLINSQKVNRTTELWPFANATWTCVRKGGAHKEKVTSHLWHKHSSAIPINDDSVNGPTHTCKGYNFRKCVSAASSNVEPAVCVKFTPLNFPREPVWLRVYAFVFVLSRSKTDTCTGYPAI